MLSCRSLLSRARDEHRFGRSAATSEDPVAQQVLCSPRMVYQPTDHSRDTLTLPKSSKLIGIARVQHVMRPAESVATTITYRLLCKVVIQ